MNTDPTFSATAALPTLPASITGGLFSNPTRSTVEVVPDPIDGASRIAGLLVAAARADGELGEEEYGHIVREARAAGADDKVMKEIQDPRPLERLVGGVRDPKLASDLYVLAFAVVRADEDVNAAERAWLAKLAELFGPRRGLGRTVGSPYCREDRARELAIWNGRFESRHSPRPNRRDNSPAQQ